MYRPSAIDALWFFLVPAVFLIAAFVFVGCAPAATEGPPAVVDAPEQGAEAAEHSPHETAENAGGTAVGADETAWDPYAAIAALGEMDNRTPVPLQPMMAWHQKQNMMDHLVVIQEITDALAREDWDAVAASAARIESSPEMQQMCQHMGAGAAGFTELAFEFHRRADAIAPAARSQDTAAVLRATSHTLAACTSCHNGYRQEVVDAATWASMTGVEHDPSAMHGGPRAGAAGGAAPSAQEEMFLYGGHDPAVMHGGGE